MAQWVVYHKIMKCEDPLLCPQHHLKGRSGQKAREPGTVACASNSSAGCWTREDLWALLASCSCQKEVSQACIV